MRVASSGFRVQGSGFRGLDIEVKEWAKMIELRVKRANLREMTDE